MQEITFKFNDDEITFNFDESNLKVNATQMAKVFGKNMADFTNLQNTQDFISACIECNEPDFIALKTEEDVITSVKGVGTWMHRFLALKFAAWLNIKFDLWIISTINRIVLGDMVQYKKSLKEAALKELEIQRLREELREVDPRFIELEILELEKRQGSYGRGRFNRSQMNMFKEAAKENV